MTPWGNQFDFKVGYLAESNEFSDPTIGGSAANPRQGLFGGNNALTAEIGYKPSDAFKLRLLYIGLWTNLKQKMDERAITGEKISDMRNRSTDDLGVLK
jgi:hypothetical protein